MNELIFRAEQRGLMWCFLACGPVGGLLLADHWSLGPGASRLALVAWVLSLMGVGAVMALTASVRADRDGIRSWNLIRRRTLRWDEVADLRMCRRFNPRGEDHLLVEVVRQDGGTVRLPQLLGSWWDRNEGAERMLQALQECRQVHRPGR
ncbi:PH domain-containing protein [Kitasatospora sp. NPDC002040]|uniref:PH domain-containing protein n=1 Tax=Kitasatospora sp. NPDC002040 TaxID=3154661 RepID=UPI003325C42F